MELGIASASFVLAFSAFIISIYFWKKQFRPILSAMVRTHPSTENIIKFDLEIINCGSLPAKNVRLSAKPQDIENALTSKATEEFKERWLACFNETIPILHNNSSCRCSFGMSLEFWKYRTTIPIIIEYEGFWWGKKYTDKATLHIVDSDSFTGYSW